MSRAQGGVVVSVTLRQQATVRPNTTSSCCFLPCLSSLLASRLAALLSFGLLSSERQPRYAQWPRCTQASGGHRSRARLLSGNNSNPAARRSTTTSRPLISICLSQRRARTVSTAASIQPNAGELCSIMQQTLGRSDEQVEKVLRARRSRLSRANSFTAPNPLKSKENGHQESYQRRTIVSSPSTRSKQKHNWK